MAATHVGDPAAACQHSQKASKVAMAMGHVAISGLVLAGLYMQTGNLVAPFDKVVHGEKWAYQLQGQLENFGHANELLKQAIELHRRLSS